MDSPLLSLKRGREEGGEEGLGLQPGIEEEGEEAQSHPTSFPKRISSVCVSDHANRPRIRFTSLVLQAPQHPSIHASDCTQAHQRKLLTTATAIPMHVASTICHSHRPLLPALLPLALLLVPLPFVMLIPLLFVMLMKKPLLCESSLEHVPDP